MIVATAVTCWFDEYSIDSARLKVSVPVDVWPQANVVAGASASGKSRPRTLPWPVRAATVTQAASSPGVAGDRGPVELRGAGVQGSPVVPVRR